MSCRIRASSEPSSEANLRARRIRKPSSVMSTDSRALALRWLKSGMRSSGPAAGVAIGSINAAAAVRAAREYVNFTVGSLLPVPASYEWDRPEGAEPGKPLTDREIDQIGVLLIVGDDDALGAVGAGRQLGAVVQDAIPGHVVALRGERREGQLGGGLREGHTFGPSPAHRGAGSIEHVEIVDLRVGKLQRRRAAVAVLDLQVEADGLAHHEAAGRRAGGVPQHQRG